MMFLLKILLMIIFVFSGGILVNYYQKHKVLVTLAGIVTLGGSAYLGKDICADLNCEKIFSLWVSSNSVKAESDTEPDAEIISLRQQAAEAEARAEREHQERIKAESQQ